MRILRDLADLVVGLLYRLVMFSAIIFVGVVIISGFMK